MMACRVFVNANGKSENISRSIICSSYTRDLKFRVPHRNPPISFGTVMRFSIARFQSRSAGYHSLRRSTRRHVSHSLAPR